MIKEALLIMITMAFLSASAIAGTRPEFDIVGDDQDSIFNCLSENLVLSNNPINADSDFTSVMDIYMELDPLGQVISIEVAKESFKAPAQLTSDLCFPGYYSALTTPGKAATYVYRIVLQMDPKSDLDIEIQDCVYRPSSETIFGSTAKTGAFQTGRAVNFLYDNFFYPGRTPSVTVKAIPGQFASSQFTKPFYFMHKTQGNFIPLPFVGLLYTSKGIWKENLLARMPIWQGQGACGTVEYPLSAGDIIEVTIDIPHNGVTDVRYGEKSVGIKYVGEQDTVYTAAWATGSTVYP
nr:hypothetical protein [uncultured Desulfobacter sp.]